MVLGPPELLLRHPDLLQVADLLEDRLQDLRKVQRVARGVDVERPRVDVRLDARVDRVDEPLALPHFLEEARGHAAADHVVQDEQGDVIGGSMSSRLFQDRKSTRLNSSHGYTSYAV